MKSLLVMLARQVWAKQNGAFALHKNLDVRFSRLILGKFIGE
jgi:hypothetical protein